MDRPEFQACLRALQAGDMLHVHSIDRLTRSLQDLLVILEDMADRNVTVKFYKENLIFSGESSPFQRLHLQIIGAVAEFLSGPSSGSASARASPWPNSGANTKEAKTPYRGRDHSAGNTCPQEQREHHGGWPGSSASRARQPTAICNTRAATGSPVRQRCCRTWMRLL